jgi:hypothetical protein
VEEVTVTASALQCLEMTDLLDGLSAFRYDVKPKRAGEVHDGLDDFPALVALASPSTKERSILSVSTGNRWR